MKNSIPGFYNENNAADSSYRSNSRELLLEAQDYRNTHKIRAGSSDKQQVELVLIDLQKDFTMPDGALYVGGRDGQGAVNDNKRISQFIYENLPYVSKITPTFDTHVPFQIFSPAFWLTADGKHPNPFTFVVARRSQVKDYMNPVLVIEEGDVYVNPAVSWLVQGNNYTWLKQYVMHYCDELERQGKYDLYLWPEHCIAGDDYHALAGIIQEARMFHSYVRGMHGIEIKGARELVENYSVLSPEVLVSHDGIPVANKNEGTIDSLMNNSAIIICGQAGTHCVPATIYDLLKEIQAHDPTLAQKVWIMEDGMSAVVTPDVDFTSHMEKALQDFKDAGMNTFKSSDNIADLLNL